MKKKQWKEKRRFRRVSIFQELLFGDRQLRPLDALSEAGMFIATPDVFMKGSIIDLKFKLYNTEKPIVVKAEVRHVQKGRGMGVKFINLKPEDRKRLRQFVQKF